MPDLSFTVRVVYEYGGDERPLDNAKVAIFDEKHVYSTQSWEETTDEDGVASFAGDWMFDHGVVKIFVNGDDYGTYDVSDGDQITIAYEFD